MRRALKPNDSLSISIRFLKLLGFWSIEGNAGTRIIYMVYGQIMYVLVSALYAFTMLMYAIKMWGDLTEVIDTIYLMVTITCTVFKFGLVNKWQMKTLIATLNFEQFTSQSQDQDHFVEDAMDIAKRNCFYFNLACSIACCGHAIDPLFAKDDYILPLKAEFPFPTNVSPYYEIAYVYQVLGVWFGGLLNASLDTLVAGLILHACAQLEILKHSLQHVRQRALLLRHDICTCDPARPWLCPLPVHTTKNNTDLEEQTHMEIVKCIQHHQAIIKFVADIQSTFTLSMFSQFTSSMIVICITAFELTVIPPFTLQFYSIVVYIFTIIIEIYLYCWYGNELLNTSTTLNDAIFKSEWYRFGPRNTKLLLIMMERAKHPLRLSAAKLFHLSLDTFTSILKSAYSFYAVLNNIDIDVSTTTIETYNN